MKARSDTTKPRSKAPAGKESARGEMTLDEVCLFDHPDPYMSEDERKSWTNLRSNLLAELAPKTVIEHALVSDIASSTWEAALLQRVKADILQLDRGRAMEVVLTTCADGDPKDKFSVAHQQFEVASLWWQGDEDAARSARSLLAAHGLQSSAIRAQSYEHKIAVIEAIERLIARAQDRREKQYRELERIRAVMAIHARDVGPEATRHNIADAETIK